MVYLPEAKEELIEAAKYYEESTPGLGVVFLASIERAEHFIRRSPMTWPVLEGNIRRFLVRRFPFGIVYSVVDTTIVIVAVAHLRRKPGYWKQRIS